MNVVEGFLSGWKFDLKSSILTILVIPAFLFILTILKKHLKQLGSYLLEGIMYWFSRSIKRSLAGTFTLKRYCRLRLAEENRYLYVPSTLDIKLDIDKVFVTLTMKKQGNSGQTYSHKDVLSVGNRLRIVGDPGSGKSSLVKRLFRDACNEGSRFPRNARFPILIELKNLCVPDDMQDKELGPWFVEKLREESEKTKVYQMRECYDAYAEGSGLLILLDGLDEVSSSAYTRVHKAILALSERLGHLSEHNIIVLTMRFQFHQQVKDAYRTAFGHALFLKPFTPGDIYKFLTRWPFSENADQHITRIYGELTDRPTLREMCSNPLVLAMYVAEDQAARHIVAPDSRTEFYNKVTEELILKRRLHQTGPVQAHTKLREQREGVLGCLAYQHLLDVTQPSNSLAWNEALKVVQNVFKCSEGEAELKFREIAKETGLISEERPLQCFRFIHLTFCEFLAAFEAVQGQSDGWSKLLGAHRDNQKNQSRPELRSRLVEVIPFAAGLLPRVKRPSAIEDVARLGDRALLTRCFLETKLYDHQSWPTFVEEQKQTLLKTPESKWDDKWLRDLHLFNVVVRDANQCSAHITLPGKELDLEEFFRALVGKQKDSLMKLLSAYARQDAAAAFRLAEVSNLDLIRDFPQIVLCHCDQPPFLALLLERFKRETKRVELYAALFAESALRFPSVASTLYHTPPYQMLQEKLIGVDPKSLWYKESVLPERLYTQLLSVALSQYRVEKNKFPLLNILSQLRTPGSQWVFSWFFQSGVIFLVSSLYFYVMDYLSSKFTINIPVKLFMLALIIFYGVFTPFNLFSIRRQISYKRLILGFDFQGLIRHLISRKFIPKVFVESLLNQFNQLYGLTRKYAKIAEEMQKVRESGYKRVRVAPK